MKYITQKNIIIFAVLLAVAIFSWSLWPNVYVVAPVVSTLQEGEPADFITVQDCVTNAGRNDTCMVKGTFDEQVIVAQAGLTIEGGTVQCITVTAVDTTVKNMTVKGCPTFGIISTAARTVIENSTITDSRGIGIFFQKPSTNGRASGNLLKRNSQACVEIRGSGHVIENNDCSGSIQYPDGVTRVGGMDADCFHWFGSNQTFSGNYCHDITLGAQGGGAGELSGTNTDPHIDCISTWGDPSNGVLNGALFENNVCFLIGNPMAKSVQMEGGTSNVVFRNNTFNTETCANLSGSSQYAGTPVNNITFDHNTCVSSNKSGAQGIDSKNATNVTVTDNIFAYMPAFWLRGGNSISGNCIWQVGNRAVTSGEIRADPQFEDKAARNFHLKVGSPCTGKGVQFEDIPVTPIPPSPTTTKTATVTFSPTPKTPTPSQIPSLETVFSPTFTETGTATQTGTNSPTATPTATSTKTRTPTATASATSTHTLTATPTVTPSSTLTSTPTGTPTMTPFPPTQSAICRNAFYSEGQFCWYFVTWTPRP